MRKDIVLCGYGNVGHEFIRLLCERGKKINSENGIQIKVVCVSAKDASVYDKNGIDLRTLLEYGNGSAGISEYCRRTKNNMLKDTVFSGDLMVECTPTDVISGEPGISNIKKAAENNMDVVLVSKGALVTNFGYLMKTVKERNINIKYSGAAAAALPTIDTALYSLKGSSILSLKGILNGTTNYILTRMGEGKLSFDNALKEAKDKGIAETNSDFDVQGIDSACKIIILANTIFRTEYKLGDIKVSGIENITSEDIICAKKDGFKLKLIASAEKMDENINIEVGVRKIHKDSFLSSINGTNKGIIFTTDTMGEVAVSGGASNPRGAAAAALKDILNIYC